jgi:hypothetical protein
MYVFIGYLFFGLVIKFIPEATFVPAIDTSKNEVGMDNLRG